MEKHQTDKHSLIQQVLTQGPNVNWVRRARWVKDTNIWTSSGITAGIDMMYAFIAEQYGEDIAVDLANRSEYTRRIDSQDDPFCNL